MTGIIACLGYIGPGIPITPVWPLIALLASYLGLGRPGRWQPVWFFRVIGGAALAGTIIGFVFSLPRVLFPAVLVAVLNGLVGRWMIRRQHLQLVHRLKQGRCLHCGYDLTGNTSGLCPECGKAIGDTN